jgi:DNA processing protein
MTVSLTEDECYAAALAAFDIGPERLRRLLSGWAPTEAWDAIVRGRHPGDPEQRCRRLATPALVERVTRACRAGGVAVRPLGAQNYPAALAADPTAPAVVFSWGDPGVLEGRPRVTVVGTRAATRYGLDVASELGRDLARSGCVVVSGLAPGIDAAAHAGALRVDDARPVAVLGAAIGDPLGASRAALCRTVAARGVVLSELPPGVRSARWRFATRNRVMAALAHVVVVVESHHRGGALHTAAAAAARGVALGAVPGSVRSAASAGTNALLVDGALPIRGVEDVLSAVDLAIASSPDICPPRRDRRPAPGPASGPGPGAVGHDRLEQRVLALVDHDPAPLDRLLHRGDVPMGDLCLGLEQLAGEGLVEEECGGWRRCH